MAGEDHEDNTIYKVVMNHEEQYSIWPDYKEIPAGWSAVGKAGPKQECLDYIKEIWTDMRPLSLRKKMEEMERERQAAQTASEYTEASRPNILGVSALYHESACCLLQSGRPVAAATEERFSRLKHAARLPVGALRHCL